MSDDPLDGLKPAQRRLLMRSALVFAELQLYAARFATSDPDLSLKLKIVGCLVECSAWVQMHMENRLDREQRISRSRMRRLRAARARIGELEARLRERDRAEGRTPPLDPTDDIERGPGL